jgi:hypothetical protein
MAASAQTPEVLVSVDRRRGLRRREPGRAPGTCSDSRYLREDSMEGLPSSGWNKSLVFREMMAARIKPHDRFDRSTSEVHVPSLASLDD